jgi:hypothetical protein
MMDKVKNPLIIGSSVLYWWVLIVRKMRMYQNCEETITYYAVEHGICLWSGLASYWFVVVTALNCNCKKYV